jgi:hypothetical protein
LPTQAYRYRLRLKMVDIASLQVAALVAVTSSELS